MCCFSDKISMLLSREEEMLGYDPNVLYIYQANIYGHFPFFCYVTCVCTAIMSVFVIGSVKQNQSEKENFILKYF